VKSYAVEGADYVDAWQLGSGRNR